MPTILEALKDDHNKHRTLLDILSKTHGDSEDRRELFVKVKNALQGHAKAEERAFYSVLLGNEKTQEESAHSIKEHQEIDELIEAIEELDYSSPQWLQKLKDLKSLVEHHEAEEESDVFPMAAEVLSDDRQQELGELFCTELEKEMADA